MNKLQFLLLSCLLLFLAGACKKKDIPETSATPGTAGLKVDVLNTEFRTFAAKGKMQLEMPDEKIASSVTLRIKKDSVIWVSVVPALGIEVARLKITPDTIQLLDRLHRQYFSGSFSMLQKRYNISATFDMLQAVLIGNYLPGPAGSEKEIKRENQLQQTRQQRNQLTIDQFLDTEIRKLKQLNISDSRTQDAINATYKEFEQVENRPMPTEILLLLQRASAPDPKSKDMVISVKYNRITLNEADLAFPFSIPADYEKK